MSSATEQRTRRQRQRAALAAKKASRAPSHPRPILATAPPPTQPEEREVKQLIKGMQQLGADFKHLCTEQTCKERCKGVSSSVGMEDDTPLTIAAATGRAAAAGDGKRGQRSADLFDGKLRPEEEEEEALLENSDLQKELEAMLSNLPMPIFYGCDGTLQGLSQEEISQMIASGALRLPEFKASYTQELLKEAGKFYIASAGRLVDFPVCIEGERCVMKTQRGIQGMGILYPHEYQHLMLFGTCPSSVGFIETPDAPKGDEKKQKSRT